MKETFDTLVSLCIVAGVAFIVYLLLQKKDGCGCGSSSKGSDDKVMPSCPGSTLSSPGMGGKRSMS